MNERILTLIETSDFESLRTEDRALILQTMSAEEFDSMHLAARAMKNYFSQPNTDMASNLYKKNILDTFHAHQNTAPRRVPLKWVVNHWQSVAAVLLTFLVTTWYFNFSITSTAISKTVLHDTIFTQKPLLITKRDTVFRDVIKPVMPISSAAKQQPSPHQMTSDGETTATPDFHVLSISEIDHRSVKGSGSSIRNDELIDHFEFTHLR